MKATSAINKIKKRLGIDVTDDVNAVLNGTAAARKVVIPWKGRVLSFYIDPQKIDPGGLFPPEMARYTAFVKSSKPAQAGAEVLVPGEPESRMRAKRNRFRDFERQWLARCKAEWG